MFEAVGDTGIDKGFQGFGEIIGWQTEDDIVQFAQAITILIDMSATQGGVIVLAKTQVAERPGQESGRYYSCEQGRCHRSSF